MRKDPRIFLEHILENVGKIEMDTQDLAEAGFLENALVQDAVIRRLEIIGEAVRNLPDDFKQAHPEVPWQDIADMRNKLIHEYFGVDLGLVWQVVKGDLPSFNRRVAELFRDTGTG